MRYFILLLLLCAGCGKPKAPGVTSQTPVTDSFAGDRSLPSHEVAVYAELWRVCKEAHVGYRIHYLDDRGYYGELYNSRGFGLYVYTRGFTSGPTEAAERLILVVRNLKDHPVRKDFDSGKVIP